MFGGWTQCDERTTVVQLPKENILAALKKREEHYRGEWNERRDRAVEGKTSTTRQYGFFWKRTTYTISEEDAKQYAVWALPEWERNSLKYYEKQADEAQSLIDLINLSVSETVAIGVKDFEDIKEYYEVTT